MKKLSPKTKILLKMTVAFALVAVLIATDKLNLEKLAIYTNKPHILGILVAVWSIFFVLMGSARWFLLLRSVGVVIPYDKTVKLQLVGFLFNTVMPGAVGGDLIKGIYIVREQKGSKRSSAATSIVVDRVLGLLGLFACAGVVMLMNFDFVWERAELRVFVLAIAGVVIGTVLLFCSMWVDYNKIPLVGKLLNQEHRFFGVARDILESFQAYRNSPGSLFVCLLISVTNQAVFMFLFWQIAVELNQVSISIGQFAVVFPLGLLAASLPLAPGGLGLGHIAFENLLGLVGIAHGSDIFNIVFCGTLAMNLFGIIPYLLYKREIGVDFEDVVLSESKP